MRNRVVALVLGLVVLSMWLGCGKGELEEVRIEGIPLFEGEDLSEVVVEVPVARPVQPPVAWPEQRPAVEPPFVPAKKLFRKPALEPVDMDALVLYVEGDLLPESWLTEWGRKEGLLVTQRRLPSGEVPRDADLLLGTPVEIARWGGKGFLRSLGAGDYLSGLAPAFLGHPFDKGNRWSRPVRWTPYVLVARAERAEEFKKMTLEQLMRDGRSAWPEDAALLGALRLKDQGASANTRQWARQTGAIREALQWTEGRRAGWGEGWKKLVRGEAEVVLVRASGRAGVGGEVGEMIWWFPEGGTVVAMQSVAVAESSKRAEAAERFLAFLLEPERQGRMVAETGYFPVRLSGFEGLAVSGKRLPEGKGWLDRAEFVWREGRE